MGFRYTNVYNGFKKIFGKKLIVKLSNYIFIKPLQNKFNNE